MNTRLKVLSATLLIPLALFGTSVAGAVPAAPGASASQVAGVVTRQPRASLHLTLGRSKAWLGQAIPITLSAQFRDVEGVTLEGVTLEGVPQLKSDAIFTSDLSREPRQSTQVVNGEPVLVATWTGTLTPSTAGELTLSVELPVRIRYHEASPQPTFRKQEEDEDPFESMMNLNPTDPTSIDRIFRSMRRSFPMGLDEPALGRAHDEALTLRTSSQPFDVQALPSAGQPPTFNGAVGQFQLQAALSSNTGSVNQPLTLRVTLKGDGDVDRVELPGVANSADWKTYPMSAKGDSSTKQHKLSQKTFEQVLIPTHGGELTVPALQLPVFDPSMGRYTTISTAELTVDIAGPPTAAAEVDTRQAPEPAAARPLPPVSLPPVSLPPPPPSTLIERPGAIGLRLSPLLLILLGSALMRVNWRRDPEKLLRASLRRSAKQGSPSAFFEAARQLIVVHFSKRWGVAEAEVTPQALRTQLGASAEPLVEAISTSEALRFGRRDLEPVELGRLCSSIEESLRKAA